MPANRLINEKSPYLLQHAHNPVDWYPWGDEAFERARELDRPVFLSIGYATCHWCHVMEHESFEDEQVAQLMNEAFINIKVDREERPDIDGIYMTVAQMTMGHGGWPLTIVMAPDRIPFFAATYIPRDSRQGRIGMLDLVPRIATAWQSDREAMLRSGASIQEHLQRATAADFRGRALGEDTLRQAFSELAGAFDRERAGFGAAPKFPAPHRILFLLRYWRRTGVENALEMAERTLDAMRAGGMYDQVGYGFHRYSTDASWLLPHFEKMLYDQAMLLLAYIESYQVKPTQRREATIREVAAYVLRDLTAPDGGFYSAEDADSEGEEGRFYVWSVDEMRAVLGEADFAVAELAWGIAEAGNFEDEATRRRTGLNVLHASRPPAEVAAALDLTAGEVERRLETARSKLFDRRVARERPLLDDKVLTDWNGLMIAALARAGAALGEPSFVTAAARAAALAHKRMWSDGVLLHRYRDGEAAIEGNLDDYAFLAWGELELHQATLESGHLRRAAELMEATVERFHDPDRDGFFFSPAGRDDLIVRRKEVYDGAAPSGNSATLYNLVRLARLTASVEYERLAQATASAFSRQVASHPSAFSFFLSALDMLVGPSQELVIAGDPDAADTRALLDVAREGYHPSRVVLLVEPDEAGSDLADVVPLSGGFTALDSRATAYLCSGFACEQPVTDANELRELIYRE